jgi:hypothetical protein
MKPGLTSFAKGVIYLIGLSALAGCLILVPELAREDITKHPTTAYLSLFFVVSAYAVATPFLIALYQTLKLLGSIEHGQAFSPVSVKALKNIKYCAIAFAVLIVVATVGLMTLLRHIGPTEDSPPFGILGFTLTFAASVIATLAAVLQQLLQSAIAIKSENDLTV